LDYEKCVAIVSFPKLWEIKTLPLIDVYPRPYLKGFNYDALDSFLVPDTE
jgi:hypothetical protein